MTTLLVDFSQLVFTSFFVNQKSGYSNDFFKYLILNQLRSAINKFRPEEVTLCCDHRSWRKSVFPHYKASRKKHADRSEIFATVDEFIQELKDNFPYKIVKVEGAEGDDCIAVIAKNLKHDVVIVSQDKDLLQLVKPGIKVYNPVKNLIHTYVSPEYLTRLILSGDSGDGIPNIMSDGDTFITEGKRQEPFGEKRIDAVIQAGVDVFLEEAGAEVKKNFERNKQLIDLTQCPEEIQHKIMLEYWEQKPVKDLNKIKTYIAEKGMNSLYENFGEFYLEKVMTQAFTPDILDQARRQLVK